MGFGVCRRSCSLARPGIGASGGWSRTLSRPAVSGVGCGGWTSQRFGSDLRKDGRNCCLCFVSCQKQEPPALWPHLSSISPSGHHSFGSDVKDWIPGTFWGKQWFRTRCSMGLFSTSGFLWIGWSAALTSCMIGSFIAFFKNSVYIITINSDFPQKSYFVF